MTASSSIGRMLRFVETVMVDSVGARSGTLSQAAAVSGAPA